MKRFYFVVDLFKEFVQFAAANKAWWLLPIVVLIFAVAAMMTLGNSAAPLIYTLF